MVSFYLEIGATQNLGRITSRIRALQLLHLDVFFHIKFIFFDKIKLKGFPSVNIAVRSKFIYGMV